MIIKQKIGTLKDVDVKGKELDKLPIQWYETGKRILHKKTISGREMILKFMNQSPEFAQDDVLYQDESFLIIVDIQPCDAIVVHPDSMFQMARLCYEIGNKHLPLFFEDNTILIPFDEPLFKWLKASGFDPVQDYRKLLYPLRTTVSAHAHSDNNTSLFSKILKLTSPSND